MGIFFLIHFLLFAMPFSLLAMDHRTVEKSWPWDDRIKAMRPAGSVEITLREEVVVDGLRIYLSDVASCAGSDTLCEEIYGVDLGASPQPKTTKIINKGDIDVLLQQEWPKSIILYAGNPFVKVTTNSLVVSQQEILAGFELALRQKFSHLPDVMFKINHLRLNQQLAIRKDNFKLNFPDLESEAPFTLDQILARFSGHSSFEGIVVQGENHEDIRFKANAQISVFRFLPVARKNLVTKSIVRSEDLSEDWVPMGRTAGSLAISKDQVIGRQISSPVPVGRPFTFAQLSKPSLLKRGQSVALIIQRGNLKVSGRGRVKADASLGDTVDVENMATGKSLSAIVLDSQSVMVGM
jgi:flagella basal body P-ring formation protein FlgA